jgi:hypothetical protein
MLCIIRLQLPYVKHRATLLVAARVSRVHKCEDTVTLSSTPALAGRG